MHSPDYSWPQTDTQGPCSPACPVDSREPVPLVAPFFLPQGPGLHPGCSPLGYPVSPALPFRALPSLKGLCLFPKAVSAPPPFPRSPPEVLLWPSSCDCSLILECLSWSPLQTATQPREGKRPCSWKRRRVCAFQQVSRALPSPSQCFWNVPEMTWELVLSLTERRLWGRQDG